MNKYRKNRNEYSKTEDSLFAAGILVVLITLLLTAGLSMGKAVAVTVALVVIILAVGVVIQAVKKPKRGVTFNRGVAK